MVGEGSGAAEHLRREGPRRNGAGCPLQGGTGGPPPGLCGGVPSRLARAKNRAARAVFLARASRRGPGRGAVCFAPRPTRSRSESWGSGADRVGFAHPPGFFSPARRRPLAPRRRAGRGRQAGGARNHSRYGFSAPVAGCRECRAARPRRAARQSARRAKAPSSGSDAGAHSWRINPLGRFVGDSAAVWPSPPAQAVGRRAPNRGCPGGGVAAARSGSDASAGARARVAAGPWATPPTPGATALHRLLKARHPQQRGRAASGGARRGRSPAASRPPNRSGAGEPRHARPVRHGRQAVEDLGGGVAAAA